MACDFVVAAESARWGMPEVDVGITPRWGGTTRLARLIGRRMTKEINILGALHPAARAAELGLWNRVVPSKRLDEEVAALVEVLLSKNQQAVRQLKFIINNGVEADLHTAQAFEALSAGLTGAVNGGWRVEDADAGAGLIAFASKNELWDQPAGTRQGLLDGRTGHRAREFAWQRSPMSALQRMQKRWVM
jgi:enoyl-CoA hydratase